MIERDKQMFAQFKAVKIIAVVMLLVAPLIYLLLAYIIEIPFQGYGQQAMLFYILFILGIVQPIVLPVIDKSQINSYKNNNQSSMTPANLFTTLSIMKISFIEAIYIYSLVIYFLSGNIYSMLYFYPVGIVWSFIYWPKMSTYEKFLKKVESDVSFT